MAQKILAIKEGFFLDGGLHLAYPERPMVYLPDNYEPPAVVVRSIKAGTLIDVNRNVLDYGDEPKKEAPKKEAPAPEGEEAEEKVTKKKK
jgi:hypothetical protein